MPQLDPFYFKNEVIIAFITLFLILYVLSKFILPVIVRLTIIRTYLTI